MDFRDVVHATQAQMLAEFGENVFQGKVIEVHIALGGPSLHLHRLDGRDVRCLHLHLHKRYPRQSLEIAKSRIQVMIDKGMDNDKQVLQGLWDKAQARITGLKSGERPALIPDANAKYRRVRRGLGPDRGAHDRGS